ncbi:hypothetical protein G3R49_10795 [Shewanella sp. WXL01]|uniref:Uncharacterized protein n=1 Tax=Shewanella maritima TaxID=2520507 RepID=A0A411PKF2_9GAMM|nr:MULTISPECIES: hypothetical protein [Shewanella]NKF51041.1 hypothetical protein [Shewanella sp. WXL01]QBF83998.1 hypothetical protein EXU30_15960 [Shewanella maritima]
MMINWLNKLLGRSKGQQRTKVEIDLNYETHSFKMDDIHREGVKADADVNAELAEDKLTK